MSSLRKPVNLKSTSSSTKPLPTSAALSSSRAGTPSSSAIHGSKKPVPGTSTGRGSNGAPPPPSGPGTQHLLDKDRKMVEYSSPADKCPVCFSDRYLNPSLRLLVSKCYHKMCESCIDRIFTLGPGPCPICGQIIRKTQFTPQTYEDLTVEKEVVIRRRIAKIFNKTQEDFPDLDTYNNYLEEVEDLTFNLINSVDVEETDRRVLAYQRENAEQIDQQSSHEEREAELLRLAEDSEKREKAERAAEFAAQDERDKADREKDEKDLIKMLEESEGGSAEMVIKKQQRAVALKRSSARQADFNPTSNSAKPTTKPSLLSKYMGFNRANYNQEPERDPFEPEDPTADYDELWYDYRDLFTPRGKETPYVDRATEDALLDRKKMAGGMDVQKSVWERAVRSAVMGLWTSPVGVADIKVDGDGDTAMRE